jgi:hypothetical protein
MRDQSFIEGMHAALDLARGVDPETTMAEYQAKLIALIKSEREG